MVEPPRLARVTVQKIQKSFSCIVQQKDELPSPCPATMRGCRFRTGGLSVNNKQRKDETDGEFVNKEREAD
jgi:hypothetical protein